MEWWKPGIRTLCRAGHVAAGLFVPPPKNKKAVLLQGNRAMPQLFFSV